MSAFHRIPAGTKLYRGCSDTPEIGTDDVIYFTLTRKTAATYASSKYRGCVIEIVTLKDIDLLDLSTAAAWEKLDAADWSKDEMAYKSYKGVLNDMSDDRADFIDTTVKSGFFQDGKVEKKPCKQTPEKECTTLDWHGIKWGPEKDQFKRYSNVWTDVQFIESLRAKCKQGYPDLCIAGVYAPPLPSAYHSMMDETGTIHRNVFHEELAMFGLPADSFKKVDAGGKKRKTRRGKHKLTRRKRTRKQ